MTVHEQGSQSARRAINGASYAAYSDGEYRKKRHPENQLADCDVHFYCTERPTSMGIIHYSRLMEQMGSAELSGAEDNGSTSN